MEPVFKDFYSGKYEKDEFLLDVDVEFSKVKRLLEKHPTALKDDPTLSVDYLKIIGLIKGTRMLEDTSEPYDGGKGAYERDWFNADELTTRQKRDRE